LAVLLERIQGLWTDKGKGGEWKSRKESEQDRPKQDEKKTEEKGPETKKIVFE